MKPRIYAFALLGLLLSAAGYAAEDVLVADFESEDYEKWTTTGDAFGEGPAPGTLPRQMNVSGYQGDRLVNSFHGGDRSVGTLTSPTFVIQRDYLTFLIGGGGFADQTCINLIVNGEVVRTAVGPNINSGGSEALVPHHWPVQDLKGERAMLQIVDKATGGWGHINVDHIVQTDAKPAVPNHDTVWLRDLVLEKQYLLFPVRTGARMARVDLQVGEHNVREFDVELASSPNDADFWAYLDIRDFHGNSATLRVAGTSEESVELIRQSDEIPGQEKFYTEPLRPQFHFSQRVGWNNDPNGMVYYDGEWHLYFQHNPYGWNWGNMHWGHAVSKDLVHWKQLPIAIYNKERGDWAFSGGAIVDEHNTAGWQTGQEKVIVASWTSTGRGECLAYSNDRGRTFTEYEGNPVIKHQGRDPKIIWYEPGKHWVMVVYNESQEHGRAIDFYRSDDLKSWTMTSKLPGYYECPELVELPVDDDPKNTRWIVFAADAQYAIGSFDGKTFVPEHDGKHRVHYGDYYASQIFNNAPDDRKIQIGWARIPMPGMPFNQTFSFPSRLSLRTTSDGIRMHVEPVQELASLYQQRHAVSDRVLSADKPVEMKVEGELFDIRATFRIEDAQSVGVLVGQERIVYDCKTMLLQEAPLEPIDGMITLQILVDRPMLEVFGNAGRVVMTSPRKSPGAVSSITAFAEGGDAHLVQLEVHQLRSIWK